MLLPTHSLAIFACNADTYAITFVPNLRIESREFPSIRSFYSPPPPRFPVSVLFPKDAFLRYNRIVLNYWNESIDKFFWVIIEKRDDD